MSACTPVQLMIIVLGLFWNVCALRHASDELALHAETENSTLGLPMCWELTDEASLDKETCRFKKCHNGAELAKVWKVDTKTKKPGCGVLAGLKGSVLGFGLNIKVPIFGVPGANAKATFAAHAQWDNRVKEGDDGDEDTGYKALTLTASIGIEFKAGFIFAARAKVRFEGQIKIVCKLHCYRFDTLWSTLVASLMMDYFVENPNPPPNEKYADNQNGKATGTGFWRTIRNSLTSSVEYDDIKKQKILETKSSYTVPITIKTTGKFSFGFALGVKVPKVVALGALAEISYEHTRENSLKITFAKDANNAQLEYTRGDSRSVKVARFQTAIPKYGTTDVSVYCDSTMGFGFEATLKNDKTLLKDALVKLEVMSDKDVDEAVVRDWTDAVEEILVDPRFRGGGYCAAYEQASVKQWADGPIKLVTNVFNHLRENRNFGGTETVSVTTDADSWHITIKRLKDHTGGKLSLVVGTANIASKFLSTFYQDDDDDELHLGGTFNGIKWKDYSDIGANSIGEGAWDDHSELTVLENSRDDVTN